MEQEDLKPFVLQTTQELIKCGAIGVVEFEIQLEVATIKFDIVIK